MIAITIVLALLVVFVSVLGGIMTSAKPWQRNSFLIAGILMVILVFAQAIVNDISQRNRDAKIDELRGRYNGLAEYILREKPAVIKDKSERAVKEFSNHELLLKVTTLAKNMRDFEINFKIEEGKNILFKGTAEQIEKQRKDKIEIDNIRHKQYENEFRKRFSAEVVSYDNELRRRLNLLPPSKDKYIYELLTMEGTLAGPHPVSNLALYLENLAKQLSQQNIEDKK